MRISDWSSDVCSSDLTRPSDLRPTSINATSFSIAVTMPLTTRPSKEVLSPRDSSRSAAKSSRVGIADVAINKCLSIHYAGQPVVSGGLALIPPAGPFARRASVHTVRGERTTGTEKKARKQPSEPTHRTDVV